MDSLCSAYHHTLAHPTPPEIQWKTHSLETQKNMLNASKILLEL